METINKTKRYSVERTHKTWIKAEIKFLNDNKLKYALKDLAYRMSRTEDSIIRKLVELKTKGFDQVYNDTREHLPIRKTIKTYSKVKQPISKVKTQREIKLLFGWKLIKID